MKYIETCGSYTELAIYSLDSCQMEESGEEGKLKYWISEDVLLYICKLLGMLGMTPSCDLMCT